MSTKVKARILLVLVGLVSSLVLAGFSAFALVLCWLGACFAVAVHR